jgi:hypothetical protein
VGWIQLAEDNIQWKYIVIMSVNLWVNKR